MSRLLLIILLLLSLPAQAAECVVLIHGLARTAGSMQKLGNYLEESGYSVANIDYPSRQNVVEELAPLVVNQGIEECNEYEPDKIHFVTHSLGGILVRQYLSISSIQSLGRVVMLGPPNNGSEVVDKMANVPGFKWLNGPAGLQLGTDEQSIPKKLGGANFEVGIIAGTRSINLILSMLIPSVDDGKVSLESAHLVNESAFLEVAVSHPFLMKNESVMENVVEFLNNGSFIDDE